MSRDMSMEFASRHAQTSRDLVKHLSDSVIQSAWLKHILNTHNKSTIHVSIIEEEIPYLFLPFVFSQNIACAFT